MPIRHNSPSRSAASGTSMQVPLTYMRATAGDTSHSVRFARSLSPSGRRMSTFRSAMPPSPAPRVGNRSPRIKWKTTRHVKVARCSLASLIAPCSSIRQTVSITPYWPSKPHLTNTSWTTFDIQALFPLCDDLCLGWLSVVCETRVHTVFNTVKTV